MGIRRITPWALALIAAVLILSGCNDGPEPRPDLLDEYDAGFASGLGLYDDYHPEDNDWKHCAQLTVKKYGVSGWDEQDPDEARVFVSGCVEALKGQESRPSAEGMGWIVSNED